MRISPSLEYNHFYINSSTLTPCWPKSPYFYDHNYYTRPKLDRVAVLPPAYLIIWFSFYLNFCKIAIVLKSQSHLAWATHPIRANADVVRTCTSWWCYLKTTPSSLSVPAPAVYIRKIIKKNSSYFSAHNRATRATC